MPRKSGLSTTRASLDKSTTRSLVETAEKIENRIILSFIKGFDGHKKFMMVLRELDEEISSAIRQE